jgi:hypothetical protein
LDKFDTLSLVRRHAAFRELHHYYLEILEPYDDDDANDGSGTTVLLRFYLTLVRKE